MLLLIFALFTLGFPSPPSLSDLSLQHIVTRRPILQKVRGQARKALPLLVSIRFHVLFHSPPGVLFTVPSRYYSLSVNWSYLALRDGPRIFTPDFSCPVLLWILLALIGFRLRGCYPVSPRFPTLFSYRHRYTVAVRTPTGLPQLVWALPRSLATTYGIIDLFSFPPLT